MEDADPPPPSTQERKGFLRVLSSLAWADGVLEQEELELLHLTASELNVALSERDLDPGDLETLATKVIHPELRQRLLAELKRLAEIDDDLDLSEVETIKFFAEAWSLEPPEMEGVAWGEIGLPGSEPESVSEEG